MKRSGFSLIEVMMVVGIIGVVTGITVPLYRDYQISNDLNLAMEQVTQGLARAKLLSQSGQQDSPWGFYVPAGIVYKGNNYATRVQSADEIYPMPSTVATTGLTEVGFSKIKGIPSATGAINLMGLNHEERTVIVNVQRQNVEVVTGDNINICHTPPGNPAGKHTVVISDSAWPTYQAQGDTLGPCPIVSSSAVSSGTSSAVSSAGSAGASSVASGGGAVSSVTSSVAGGGGGATSSSSSSVATCSDRFSVAADGTITTTGPLSVKFTSLGGQFAYGNGGPRVPIHVQYQKTVSNNWKNLFSGHDMNGTGGDTETVTGYVNGNKVIIKFHAAYNANRWLSYDRIIYSNDGVGDVKILRNGDVAPTIAGANGQTSVSSLISAYVQSGHIHIGQYDALLLADFNYPDCHTCAEADFQDAVILVQFQTPSC